MSALQVHSNGTTGTDGTNGPRRLAACVVAAVRRELPVCLRRKEARELCRQIGVRKRTFLEWCVNPPAMPEGMRFRFQAEGTTRKANIYSREGILWLAARGSDQ